MRGMGKIACELALIVDALKSIKHVSRIYLFGSYARNCATISSDVDIAIINTFTGTSMELKNQVVQRMYEVYTGDLDFQFTFVNENIFITCNKPLQVSNSIKKEGILLWQR